MAATDKVLSDTRFLTLEPRFRGNEVIGFTISKVTKSRPHDRVPVVRLTVRLPARAFAPLAPAVTIDVPEDGLAWPEPEVTVEVGEERPA